MDRSNIHACSSSSRYRTPNRGINWSIRVQSGEGRLHLTKTLLEGSKRHGKQVVNDEEHSAANGNEAGGFCSILIQTHFNWHPALILASRLRLRCCDTSASQPPTNVQSKHVKATHIWPYLLSEGKYRFAAYAWTKCETYPGPVSGSHQLFFSRSFSLSLFSLSLFLSLSFSLSLSVSFSVCSLIASLQYALLLRFALTWNPCNCISCGCRPLDIKVQTAGSCARLTARAVSSPKCKRTGQASCPGVLPRYIKVTSGPKSN